MKENALVGVNSSRVYAWHLLHVLSAEDFRVDQDVRQPEFFINNDLLVSFTGYNLPLSLLAQYIREE